MSELKQIRRHHERQLKNMDKKLTMYQIHPADVDWLIQQAERVQKIEQILEDMDRQLYSEQQQNKRYKQALEFYADEENYCVRFEDDYEPILQDNGKTARQALGWEEEK